MFKVHKLKKKFLFLFCIIGLFFFILLAMKKNKPVLETNKVISLTIISPPYQKKVTEAEDIQKFMNLYNSVDMKLVLSVGKPSGWSKRIIIKTNTHNYDIIFAGTRIVINGTMYKGNNNIDKKLNEYYEQLDIAEQNYAN